MQIGFWVFSVLMTEAQSCCHDNFPASTSCKAKINCDLHHHNSNKSKRNNHHNSLKPPPQLSDYPFMAEQMFSCACAEAPWLQPASTPSSPFPNCNSVTKHGIFLSSKTCALVCKTCIHINFKGQVISLSRHIMFLIIAKCLVSRRHGSKRGQNLLECLEFVYPE